MRQESYGFPLSEAMRIAAATKAVERMSRPEHSKPRRYPIPEEGGATLNGTERAVFTIDSYDADTGIAICTVKYRPYGVSVLSGEVDGKIDVEDPKGCAFDEEAADLVGRWGDADYMTAVGDSYGEGVWVCSGLCCPPA